MTPKWLVPDGSRLPMDRHGDFWLTAALDSEWVDGKVVWCAKLLMIGGLRPAGDRVAAILLRAAEECDLLWKSGFVMPLSDSMPGVFVRHGLNSGIRFHWRDDHDETIQNDLVPLTVI